MEKQIEIEAEPEAVFSVLVDLSRLPQWSALCDEVSAPDEIDEGTRFEMTLVLGERRSPLTMELEVLESPHRLVFGEVGDGVPTRFEHRVEDRGEGSRVWIALWQADEALDQEVAGHGEYEEMSWTKQTERKLELSLQALKEEAEWT